MIKITARPVKKAGIHKRAGMHVMTKEGTRYTINRNGSYIRDLPKIKGKAAVKRERAERRAQRLGGRSGR